MVFQIFQKFTIQIVKTGRSSGYEFTREIAHKIVRGAGTIHRGRRIRFGAQAMEGPEGIRRSREPNGNNPRLHKPWYSPWFAVIVRSAGVRLWKDPRESVAHENRMK